MRISRVHHRALALLAAVAALAGAMAVMMPTSGATAPTAVRLHLGSDGRYFAYGSTVQNLTTAKNGCQITSAEPVIDLSSTGAQSSPGLGADAIGVKASPSSGNGTPCTQVDQLETLKLARGTALGTRKFTGVRLDVEMTGNALVQLTLASATTSVVYRLQTGTSITAPQAAEPSYDTTAPYLVSSGPGDEEDACAAPNSSGPNSGSNDNCQWTVLPGFDFDTITLTTTVGTVSLEGGADFGNNPDYETLLYLANTAPVAAADSFTTDEDTAKQGNVLANDSDADGNPLTATLGSPPANGTVTLASNGDFTYTPALNWSGTDTFSYVASDGTASASATVTVVVAPVNDPPVAVSGTVSTPEETAVTFVVATDVDSTSLTASCTSSGAGTVTDLHDGRVTFTPPLDFNGTITVTCTVTDDLGATTSTSSTVVVGVTGVNDAPVAVDDSAEVDAGSSVVIDVLANDTDVEQDPLAVTALAGISPVGATAVANPDGTVTYTPPVGFTGAGSFTYRASDGAASSNVAVVAVTVFPVICSEETVSDTDGDVSGAFTRLSDPFECKRYTVDASATADTVLFQPEGTATVSYRGVVSFGPDPAPVAGGTGEYPLLLRYDPSGGDAFRPVQWCIDPQFDAQDDVVSATLPAGETWCVAKADTRGNGDGDLVTTWQVYGLDDPKFTR